MKEIFALVFFGILAGATIILAVRRRIGPTLTITLLIFSLSSGFLIANYDWLQRMHGHCPDGEYDRMQLTALRNQAVRDFAQIARREAEDLASRGDRIAQDLENWESRLKAAESVVQSMKNLEEEIRRQERSLKESNERLEKGRQQIMAACQDMAELALMTVRLAWLQIQTKDDSNSVRARTATQQMLDLLDQIVVLVIADPEARARFYDEVMTSLPPKEQNP